jgi:hypothetical protein
LPFSTSPIFICSFATITTKETTHKPDIRLSPQLIFINFFLSLLLHVESSHRIQYVQCSLPSKVPQMFISKGRPRVFSSPASLCSHFKSMSLSICPISESF